MCSVVYCERGKEVKSYIEQMDEAREETTAWHLWKMKVAVRKLREATAYSVVNLARNIEQARRDMGCRVTGHEWRVVRYKGENGGEGKYVVCLRCGRREKR
jgi:hypothetical protein